MSRRSNQEIERYYFEQFRVHFPLPQGVVEYTDKPDVIIRGDTAIGIEMANLYLVDGTNPGSEQVQRRRRDSVLSAAQSRHQSNGGQGIELNISFNPNHPISEASVLVEQLSVLAQQIERLPSGDLDRSLFEHIPEVRFIYLNSTPYDNPRWRASQVYSVPSLSVNRLREIVESKAQIKLNYQDCDQQWLLMVVDFMDFAQDQDITWPPSEPSIVTSFDRVILYKPQFSSYTEVPIERIG